ncbi:hypothetical protein KAURM247S_07972 [Kitasatospora aureofaciens]
MQLGRDRELDGAAPMPGGGRAQTVVGQGQLLGEVGQRLAPVGELLAEQALRVVLVAEQFALPQCVVGVLAGQFVPLGLAARQACGVGGGDVAGQRSHGPAVTGDVVHHQQQHVTVRAPTEQPGPQRKFVGQVEGVPGRVGDLLAQPRLVEAGGVDDGQQRADAVGGPDVLPGLAVDGGEDGAQHLVPADDVPQGGVEHVGVEVAGEPQAERDVVGGVGSFQLAEEPQPLLCERNRDHQDSLCPRIGRNAGRAFFLVVVRLSIRAATPATVGVSNSAWSGSSTPMAVRIRLTSRVASSE